MPAISDVFDLKYGHSLELNRLEQSVVPDAVNFVGRAARNNGVTARVKRIAGVNPAAAGTISVALGGQGGAGVAFLQPSPYYCGRDVMILTPKKPMSDQEKLWWVTCITANRFRFGFGRQANRSLKSIQIPPLNQIPDYVFHVDIERFDGCQKPLVDSSSTNNPLSHGKYSLSKISDVFDVVYGTNLELIRMERSEDGINFVARTAKNNGVVARVAKLADVDPIKGGVLSVAGGGSVLETFVQLDPFYSGRDLFYLRPKQGMSPSVLLFYAACIRANQSRYSYGRQANRTLRDLMIPAPDPILLTAADAYIKTLPYSSQIGAA